MTLSYLGGVLNASPIFIFVINEKQNKSKILTPIFIYKSVQNILLIFK